MSGFVKERSNQLAATSKNAVASGAYIYPLHGISYFITHTALHKPLYHVAIPATLLSLGVLVAVFALLYLPQTAALSIVSGPVAFVNSALLCLSESALLINVLSRAFLLEDALLEVFDATLIERGLQSLVAQGREIKDPSSSKKSSVNKLGKLLTKPLARFSPGAIFQYLLLLPLNAIPVVGTATFLVVQGSKIGPTAHARYFNLKKYSSEQKESFVKQQRGAYTAFGTAASILGLIPFASIPIQFTNAVGAALWAADIEAHDGATTELKSM